ncbi:MAG: FeoC-like transcriptional regulator, partial [Pseudodesulfovibrio sp.]
VREYDWIAHWECELLHSVGGYNEPGCVFRTAFPDEGDPEVWVTSRFEPCERLEFVRSNAQRAIHFVIGLAPEGGGTRLTWTHHVTALDERGRAGLAERATTFPAQIRMVEAMLAHFLETGKCLGREG